MKLKCSQKPSRNSIIFLIDLGTQNGRPQASKMEPKFDQEPPKKQSKNKSEKETEKTAKLGPKGVAPIRPGGMREAPPWLFTSL